MDEALINCDNNEIYPSRKTELVSPVVIQDKIGLMKDNENEEYIK